MTHLSGDFLMVFANIGVAKRGATGICTLAPRKETPPKPQRGKRSRPLDSVSRTKAKPLHGRGPAQSQGIGRNKNAVKHDSEIIGIWNDYGNRQLLTQTFIMSYAILPNIQHCLFWIHLLAHVSYSNLLTCAQIYDKYASRCGMLYVCVYICIYIYIIKKTACVYILRIFTYIIVF